MKKIHIPITVVGPGSQPADADGSEMTFMNMPSGMTTFAAPVIPEPEETVGMEKAIALADDIQQALNEQTADKKAIVFELDSLDQSNKTFMDQLLGDGEVSAQCGGDINAEIQESVLAGLWRVHYLDDNKNIIRDTMEVAAIPGIISEMTFHNAQENLDVNALNIPDTVYNAPPLLVEISDKLPEYTPGDEPHVINLSLLPHTEEDIEFLSDSLGIGPTIILSRGYGNCRISSTGTKNVWWVQYFNSQDTLILNTIEVSKVPEVAIASNEDLEDSAERLDEILSLYR
ncbi:MAG TPA: hydrogenase expression/formation protein [Cycloclasticus sp.]|nr:hydrogenase expression/formation protein [Cycloclasticus sp.]